MQWECSCLGPRIFSVIFSVFFKVVMFVMFVMFCSPASMAVKTGCFVLFDHVFQHWWKLHLPGKLWIYHNTVA